MQSNKWKLNTQDMEKWSWDFVRWCAAPVLALYFGEIAAGIDPRLALGAALTLLGRSLFVLIGKLIAGDSVPNA